MIPHEDPTNHFYSNDIFEQIRKRQPASNKKSFTAKTLFADSMTTEQKKSTSNNIEDVFENYSDKEHGKISDDCVSDQENIMDNIIKNLGFIKAECIPDGNCFFRTLEQFTGESYKHLRQAIVTSMKVKKNLYIQLFTKSNREKYFIGEESLEERCQVMSINKNWAGFPEKLASALFMGKNIVELRENNSNISWNVYIGSSEAGSLDQNSLENIYIHYDVISRHFSPLTFQSLNTPSIKIDNLYYLIKNQDNEGVFIAMKTHELSPNHEFFQNLQSQSFEEQPSGLINRQNTCYANALFQCLHSLPQIWNAFEIDKLHTIYESSLVGSVSDLLRALHNKESLETLNYLSEDIMRKIRENKPDKYPIGSHEDPQELYLDLLSVVNGEQEHSKENQRQDQANFVQTIQEHEKWNTSNTTRLLTCYTKTIRFMHSLCQHTTFEAQSLLPLSFPDVSIKSTTVDYLFMRYSQFSEQGIIDKCSNCGLANIDMSEQISMEHFSDILIISLLR